MATWEFPASEPVDVDVDVAAGSVSIVADSADGVHVSISPDRRLREEDLADYVDVEFSGDGLVVAERKRSTLQVRHWSIDVVISVPPLSRVRARTASAGISCKGELGELEAKAASGDIRAQSVRGEALLNTASGGISVDDVAGDVSADAASGRIALSRVGGDITTNTASGDIRIGTAEGSVAARSASGKVRIGSVARGETQVNSVSGDVDVSVAPGTDVYLDLSSLSGKVRCDLEASGQESGAGLRLICRTVSGSVRVGRAGQ